MKLDLTSNRLTDESASNALAAMLSERVHPPLIELKLGSNQIKPAGAQDILTAAFRTKLEVIILSNNLLTDEFS